MLRAAHKGATISADRPAHAGPHRHARLFNREGLPGMPHASRPPGLGSGLGGHGPARNMQIIRSGDLSDDTTRIALWRSREPRLDTPCRGSMAFVWSGAPPHRQARSILECPPLALGWSRAADRPRQLLPPQPDRPEGLQQRPLRRSGQMDRATRSARGVHRHNALALSAPWADIRPLSRFRPGDLGF